jgi:H+/Cl- antiporter ClcA
VRIPWLAAALAGVFRSSISLVVIMLEGTGHVGYLVPLLVGVAVVNPSILHSKPYILKPEA